MNPSSRKRVSRRSVIHLAAGFTLAGPLEALARRIQAQDRGWTGPGYGDPQPTVDETTGLPLIKLPPGFRYRTFGWTGDVMSDGVSTPPDHDGMAVIDELYGRIVLCRNHEVKTDAGSFAPAALSYDKAAGGGTTNLVVNARSGRLERSYASIGGTIKNCAGGRTPWGSWLTCEETLLGPGDPIDPPDDMRSAALERDHGFIFEVPAGRPAAPAPIPEMGRFVHEAVAVDPRSGCVYETEDRDTAGLYRFTPRQPGLLHLGGRLEMLKVEGADDVRRGAAVGKVWQTSWVEIDEPTRAHSPGTRDELGVFFQGKERGATTFARLEGCDYHDGNIYLASTSGGEAGAGQIWQYSPRHETLRLIYESPEARVLDHPDNLVVSPRGGGLVLCEDGDLQGQRLMGLTPGGELFTLAVNDIQLSGERNGLRGDFRGSEWAGVTFSRNGKWLFANVQIPGITFAITGPWASGVL